MSLDKFGKDEWAARHGERLSKRSGWQVVAVRAIERVPMWARFALLIAAGLLIPQITSNNYIIRIAGTTALMGTLALALNVVVGYAGLLDLGFVAFYGLGGYAYAYLSSEFSAVHWPTWASLPFIAILGALFGLLLGSPSLRLVGDYLAIVTLGFGQIFVQLATSLTRVEVPWSENPLNLTGGPNGIVDLDPIRLFGFTARSVTDYYYILLAILVAILLVVYRLNHSRVGRAWRSLREDDLAAESMGMPTRRLKLLAFAIGASIAGLSGAVFAAWQGAVFPSNFDVTLLITIYAIVVLGGLGSLPGVLAGAVILVVVPEILRDVDVSGMLFYLGVLITLFAALKPRWKMPLLLIAVFVFGIAVKALIGAIAPDTLAVLPLTPSIIGDAIREWLALPAEPARPGNLAFGALVVMFVLVSRIQHSGWRFAGLIPTLYLLAFVWETRLSQEPSITRLLLVGVMLVTLMNYRPNGLLGRRRVEVV